MKTTGVSTGVGELRGKPGGPFYKAWANYLVKFVEAYQSMDVPLWGLSAGNEPSFAYEPGFLNLALPMNSSLQRDFLKYDLGPALESVNFTKANGFNLLMFDDNRNISSAINESNPFNCVPCENIEEFSDMVLSDPAAAKYVSGIAFHWYDMDLEEEPTILDHVHEKYPDYFLLNTEACTPYEMGVERVSLGNWTRAEQYALDILHDLNHHASGWMDWNMAVDCPPWTYKEVQCGIEYSSIPPSL